MTYEHMFPGLDPYYAGPAQPLTTAGEELDDLDHDLSDLSEVCTFFPLSPKGGHMCCPLTRGS